MVGLLLSFVWAAEIRDLSLEYRIFQQGSILHELPGNFEPRGELNLDFELQVLGPIVWRNRVHSLIDQSQFRLVGWNFALGLEITSWLEINWEHFSKHLLDAAYPDRHFPVQDSVGVRIRLFP